MAQRGVGVGRFACCLPNRPPDGGLPTLESRPMMSPRPLQRPPEGAYVARKRDTLNRQQTAPTKKGSSMHENATATTIPNSSAWSSSIEVKVNAPSAAILAQWPNNLDSWTPSAPFVARTASMPAALSLGIGDSMDEASPNPRPSSAVPRAPPKPSGTSAGPSADGSATDRGPLTALHGPTRCGAVVLTLEDYPELTMPRLNVRATKAAIDDEGLALALRTMDEILARGAPLTVLWDLRGCAVPSRKQISIGLEWVGANSHLLDKHLQGIGIVLSGLILRSVVNFVLQITQPPQPHGCFSEEPPAFAFARDQCTEIKEWVGKKKRKQLEQQAQQAEQREEAGAPGSDSARRTKSVTRQTSGRGSFLRKAGASGTSSS